MSRTRRGRKQHEGEELKPCPFCGKKAQKESDDYVTLCCITGDWYLDLKSWNNAYCWKELAAKDKVIGELKAEVKDWLCKKCRYVYPGPPQKGFACVQCPRCGGDTGPRTIIELRELREKSGKLVKYVEQYAASTAEQGCACCDTEFCQFHAELTEVLSAFQSSKDDEVMGEEK